MANLKLFLLLFLFGFALGHCDVNSEHQPVTSVKENVCEKPDITRLGKVPDYVCDSFLDLTCSADDEPSLQPRPESSSNLTESQTCNHQVPEVFLNGVKIPTEEIQGIIFIGPPMFDTTNPGMEEIIFPVTKIIPNIE